MNDDDNNIINFEKEKSPFVHQRKEKKLEAIQQAFKQALPLDKKSLKAKKSSKNKKKHKKT